MESNKIYPRTGDTQTVYLKSVITRPNIEVGDFTIYNDFVNDPREFEKNNVLYHYPINHDRLIIEQNLPIIRRSWVIDSLWRKVYFQLRQPYAEITIHIYVSAILRGMGFAEIRGRYGMGQQRRYCNWQ